MRVSRTAMGLSPPARGSRPDDVAAGGAERSIPAHAGEPGSGGMGDRGRTVYPRPRGGASGEEHKAIAVRGLSPPTRGSQQAWNGNADGSRSIPAHAGEPPPAGCVGSSARVYPAHAGEPSSPRPRQASDRVYPRPRGGAVLLSSPTTISQGLSPPTRGSPGSREECTPLLGSIPAHAGEPSLLRRAGCGTAVYPRPRGGAVHGDRDVAEAPGLSPPTRGSRDEHRGQVPLRGSIPAHAGEPPGRS